MGKRQRRRERETDTRKQPNESLAAFNARKLKNRKGRKK